MRVLIAASALTGHVNPLLAIGHRLHARGDDVLFTTSETFQSRIEAAGLRFAPCNDGGAAAYLDVDLPPGPERWRHEFEQRFINGMPGQAAGLRRLIADHRPDVVIAGSLFLGVLPLLLDTRARPPIAVLNVSFLFLDRPDQAPVGAGLPPAKDAAERVRYAALKAGTDAAFVNPVRAHTDVLLAELGLRPLPASLPHSIVVLPDLFLQPTVPAFEYDFGVLPPGLRFVGLLPSPHTDIPLPAWWHELDGSKRVVLVTQGTLANSDFGALVEPTLAALADRGDLLVVATTGGRPLDSLRGSLPPNARAASFLPFDLLLPKVDLLVTNGGYGSVSQALAAGVPIVSAGRTEDKAEVGARISWSGVGIDLATDVPSVEALRLAILHVLDEPAFRRRTAETADAFSRVNAGHEILTAVDDLAGRSVD
ncbi:glycosyltransferase [Methylobacterium sp. NEAU K]|uniref:glycosyltransferase n=1 Tax=Methylobacterium sp. NEAU K TaxID=3064946 RepID=UPI0027348247|nr:glycosyltransferase [Methylobacterium sp. NEAU K]MDP4004788.1 glycosyltransferase [Methylobacterium sp. NEAU K]